MAAKKKGKKPVKQELIPDRAISELEDLSHQYAEFRDARQEALREEVRLGGELLNAMKRHKKTTYQRETEFGNVKITTVVEKEKVRVKIKKKDDGDDGTPVEMS
jgi:NADPH-dependent 7-cyano-7-deazaguanine reductase QueF